MPPSSKHEAVCELFRHRPELAAEILDGALGIPTPAWREARLRSENVTDDRLAELRSDVVVEYWQTERGFAVIVEVQLSENDDKHYSWPFYLYGLRYRLRCPVKLLVICPTRRVATWAGKTIDLEHPGSSLTPIVLGPDQIPLVVEPDQALGSPELAVLSALAHGGRPDGAKVLEALLHAYTVLDADHRALYHDVVNAELPKSARLYLETTMILKGYEYQSDFARRYFSEGEAAGEARGEAKGVARAVLKILGARGICVSTEIRERITSCTDLDQLEVWVERAGVVTTAQQLFDTPDATA